MVCKINGGGTPIGPNNLGKTTSTNEDLMKARQKYDKIYNQLAAKGERTEELPNKVLAKLSPHDRELIKQDMAVPGMHSATIEDAFNDLKNLNYSKIGTNKMNGSIFSRGQNPVPNFDKYISDFEQALEKYKNQQNQ